MRRRGVQDRSRRWPTLEGPVSPVAQALYVRDAEARARMLPLEDQGRMRRDGRIVRRSYVMSWACVISDSGRAFVDLGYACAADPGEPGACRTGKEWFHLLDRRGRRVDPSSAASGPGLDRFLGRLGLARVMAAGVAMTDVLAADGGSRPA